jgi:hypothetical protein
MQMYTTAPYRSLKCKFEDLYLMRRGFCGKYSTVRSRPYDLQVHPAVRRRRQERETLKTVYINEYCSDTHVPVPSVAG